MKTIFINDKRLEKYQDLFFFSAKFCGRLILQNKGSHDNLATACALFEKEYSKLGIYKQEHFNSTPLSQMFNLLIDFKSLDEWKIYKACEQFFYDVVFDVARKEQVNIKYHFIVGEKCLYGVYSNREKIQEPYRKYLSYLLENGYSGEDIKSYSQSVDFEDYER